MIEAPSAPPLPPAQRMVSPSLPPVFWFVADIQAPYHEVNMQKHAHSMFKSRCPAISARAC